LRRKLFNFAAAVSLVLCVATLLLTRGSYSIESRDVVDAENFRWHSGWLDLWRVKVEVGTLTLWRETLKHDGLADYSGPDPQLREFQHLGVRYKSSPRYSLTEIEVTIRLWLLCVLFAFLPSMFVIRRMRSRRLVLRRRCMRCGYDLRATPERCPECGTAVTPR